MLFKVLLAQLTILIALLKKAAKFCWRKLLIIVQDTEVRKGLELVIQRVVRILMSDDDPTLATI